MAARRLALIGVIALTFTAPALAQTAVEPSTNLPGVTTSSDANVNVIPGSPPPGVSDPGSINSTTTNSTTGTADHEDHCQAPGGSANSNPTSDMVTVPRADPACQ